ncbi:MAG TPA: hypothetical protein VHX15_21500 [Frankiaceae bacterium]|jgi:hypothetical protein|nr:hypothetical protein [Frankiaceae bacterium]
MARSSFSTRNSQSSVFSSLLGPVVLVAAAGLVGWLLLETVKWLIVTLLIAVGVALVVVPFFAGRRILGPAVGPDRRHRLGQLATAVLLGVTLIVLGFVVSHHGWLLIVVPAAILLTARLFGRIGSRGSSAIH